MNLKTSRKKLSWMIGGAVLVLMFFTILAKKAQVLEPIHLVKFFDQQLFSQAVRAQKATASDKTIKGGIIPHHLLASDLIADFYAHLPPTTKKIFLLGPNHYEAGEFYALTSLYNWSTPLGTVKADTDIIRTLIAAGVVRVDEKNVVNEHSLGGHLPFIRHYLPRAKIIPIMLKKEGNEDNIKMLVEQIKPYLSQAGVALVAAVDFSHNLPSSEAAKNDGETLAAMKNFNYQKLFKFGNEHLDSPSSIVALLLAMRSLGIDDLEVINNTNSARLLEFDNLETTSYFDIRFRT